MNIVSLLYTIVYAVFIWMAYVDGMFTGILPVAMAILGFLACATLTGEHLFDSMGSDEEAPRYVRSLSCKQLRVKEIIPGAQVPTRGTEYSAGLDLYACENHTIEPGMTEIVHTGIAVEVPPGCFGGIYARSGIALHKGLRPANCTGIVDADFRGEVLVALHNDSPAQQTISKGDRVAQLIIQPYVRPEVIALADELHQTERGAGGFGHTGD